MVPPRGIPALNTVTCVGHATVITGTFPRRHGIIQNAWWDRDSEQSGDVHSDRDAKTVSYAPPPEAATALIAWRFRPGPTSCARSATPASCPVAERSQRDHDGRARRRGRHMAGSDGRSVATSSAFATAPFPRSRRSSTPIPSTRTMARHGHACCPRRATASPMTLTARRRPVAGPARFHVLNGQVARMRPQPVAGSPRQHVSRAACDLAVKTMQLGQRPARMCSPSAFRAPISWATPSVRTVRKSRTSTRI